MKLFQQDRFFSEHTDSEVRKNGAFLLGLVDQLQASLLITSDWERLASFPGVTLWEQIKLQIIMLAIERKGGHKARAAKWLGISRPALFAALKKAKERKSGLLVLNKSDYEKTDCHSSDASADGLCGSKILSR